MFNPNRLSFWRFLFISKFIVKIFASLKRVRIFAVLKPLQELYKLIAKKRYKILVRKGVV